MFKLTPDSWISMMMMIIGAATIILAVMMALVQKEYKKLLSYHAISQVGYMILGIGTAVPAGIIGGLFHMLNNAMYKSCLFLTGGAVEKQTGTTDLEKLGGLGLKMPVTCVAFLITAASISGVPPFNGFFSKELIYDASLERGVIFYLAAVVGSFFTAASFLKLGHAVYFGKRQEKNNSVKEVSWHMLVPMVLIAAGCIVFGIFNAIPLTQYLQPIFAGKEQAYAFGGMHLNLKLVAITVVVLLGAVVNHIFSAKTMGSGVKASNYIRYAPVLSKIYDLAQERYFDPYEIGRKIMVVFSRIIWSLDRAIDWVYDRLIAGAVYQCSLQMKKMHNGDYALYLGWSLVGAFLLTLFLLVHA
jgi:NADH-quinone oxidoreductase subunit L